MQLCEIAAEILNSQTAKMDFPPIKMHFTGETSYSKFAAHLEENKGNIVVTGDEALNSIGSIISSSDGGASGSTGGLIALHNGAGIDRSFQVFIYVMSTCVFSHTVSALFRGKNVVVFRTVHTLHPHTRVMQNKCFWVNLQF